MTCRKRTAQAQGLLENASGEPACLQLEGKGLVSHNEGAHASAPSATGAHQRQPVMLTVVSMLGDASCAETGSSVSDEVPKAFHH